MFGSKMPTVFGLVIMNTAIWSSSLARRSSMSTEPVGSVFTVTVSKPAIVALAGFVPWALSGTSTFVRFLAAIAEIGGGDQQRGQFAMGPGRRLQRAGVEPGDLLQVLLHLVEQLRACPAAFLPADTDAGRRSPACAANRSFRFGLYFIVQEPSG